jgi:hypothetical protein
MDGALASDAAASSASSDSRLFSRASISLVRAAVEEARKAAEEVEVVVAEEVCS